MPAFRHLPVTSLIDATHNFEQIESERASELRGIQGGITPGAWTTLTLEPAWEAVAGYYTPAARIEGGAVRLRGRLNVKAAKEATAGSTVTTLAVPFRPTAKLILATVNLSALLASFLQVYTTGVVEVGTTFKATEALSLDGLTFSLT